MPRTKDKPSAPIAHLNMRGEDVPIYLSSECKFFAMITGKRYSADSLKQLQTILGKATNDGAFDPARLELGSLDTARREINGRYEDHLRTAHVSISYLDEKRVYEVDVSVSCKTGRNYSTEFQEGNQALGNLIMEEVSQRLSGYEWRQQKSSAPKHQSIHSQRIRVTQYWINPREKTRKESRELFEAARDYLQSEYDLEATEDKLRFNQDSVVLLMKNGQRFKLKLDEEQ